MADVSDVQEAVVTAIDEARMSVGATWSLARGFPEAAVVGLRATGVPCIPV